MKIANDFTEPLGRPADDIVDPQITPTSLDPVPATVLDEQSQPITIGSRVLVAEERGVYVVAGTNKDGSLTCYPGGGQGGGARSFRAEWCVPSERLAKSGKLVRVRTVAASARRARALWREQHGFPSFDRVKRGVNIPLSSA